MRRHLPVLLLLVCAVLAGATFYFLLEDRVESGDVYPPSSSLRSDPLGAMIFFESLRALPGVQVDRDFSATNQLPPGQGTVYLQFAGSSDDWKSMSADLYRIADQFLLEGGRLVVVLSPEYGKTDVVPDKIKSDRKAQAKAKTKGHGTDKKPAAPKKPRKPPVEEMVSLRQKWGLDFTSDSLSKAGDAARNVSTLPLPAKLRWDGSLVLKTSDPSWHVIYKTDRGPVIAERKRGEGSIVIATDSYFVSNEALVRDRHPELLAWLVGGADHIVFDEAHFGITDTPGIAALARKYRLHGGLLVLLILAGLFIWKNSSTLLPRESVGAASEVLAGRAAGAGFVSLLRRNIPPDRVFEVCVQEWRKTFGHGSRFSSRERSAVEEIARDEAARPARERDPVAACRKISAALRRTSAPPNA